MDDKVDCPRGNISVGEVGKRRGRGVEDTGCGPALTRCVRVENVYRSDADGRSSEIIYNNIEGSSGRIGRVYWDQVFGDCLLVSLAHTGYDVVVGVVLYEAPEHDVESHEYDYDEE